MFYELIDRMFYLLTTLSFAAAMWLAINLLLD